MLKHLDHDVAVLKIDDDGNFQDVKKVLIPERLPLSCIRENGVLGKTRIREWWEERGIPMTREGYEGLMKQLGNTGKNKLLVESKALSLSDHYWIEPEGKGLKWNNVNFYENRFDTEIGELIFNKIGKIYGRNTPDLSSGGNLRKRWKIEGDEKRALIKAGKSPYMQEPANEVIASNICLRLGIKHVPYCLEFENGEPVSKCLNMTDGKTELIEAIRLYDTKEPAYFDLGNNRYNHYVKTLKSKEVAEGVEMLDKMMVLDYLMLNHDRHFRNFGVLRDSETLDNYVFAPLYDNGSSLFHEDRAVKIRLPEYESVRTECFDKLEKQLDLVKNWSWLDISKLNGLGEESAALLSGIASVENERTKKIESVLNDRIKQLEEYIDKKYDDERGGGNSGSEGGRGGASQPDNKANGNRTSKSNDKIKQMECVKKFKTEESLKLSLKNNIVNETFLFKGGSSGANFSKLEAVRGNIRYFFIEKKGPDGKGEYFKFKKDFNKASALNFMHEYTDAQKTIGQKKQNTHRY